LNLQGSAAKRPAHAQKGRPHSHSKKFFGSFFQKRTASFRAVPHDGTVTLAEAKIAATAKFDHLDTDKEGTLDAHELTGLLGPKMGSAADTDHDKTLDHAK
jgi:hypothetical protein